MDFFENIKTIGLLILLLWCNFLVAQGGNNPFELQHRADKKANFTDLSDVLEDSTTNVAAQNPFNVIRTPQKNGIPNAEVRPTAKAKKDKPETSTIPQAVDDRNFRFWLTLVMLILLALFSTIYSNQLGRSYRAFSNENVMKMLHREKGTVSYFPYYVLYFLFLVNVGIYAYLLLRHFEILNEVPNWTLLSYTTGGIATLFFLKHTVIRFLGGVFPIQKEASMYNMTITIFAIILSIVLFVFNVLIAYAPAGLIPTFIYISFFLIGGIYFFRSIRGLSIASKFLNHNKFHFFLYLCTVEIAPILILWKMAVNG